MLRLRLLAQAVIGSPAMAKLPSKRLPLSAVLWAPDELATFLLQRGLESAARTVSSSVRLHSFDELDGPRFMRESSERLADRLALPPDQVRELQEELRKTTSVGQAVSARDWAAVPGLADRMEAALWGIFIADALAMPAHWYYDVAALRRDYGTITGYVKPLDRHTTNGIMNNHWRQNKHRAQELIGRHMNFGKEANWRTPGLHYHQGMAAGENTLNAHTARVLARLLGASAAGTYNRSFFFSAYSEFLTTPGTHNDSYAEAVHRQWIANYVLEGRSPEDCAGEENHDTPSIGGFVMLPPLVLTAVAHGEASAMASVEEHLRVTHRSDRLTGMARLYANMLLELLAGADPMTVSARVGEELGWDLPEIVEYAHANSLSDTDVIQKLGLACYISNSFPIVLYLLHKYGNEDDGFAKALLANTNAGGENCHRGSALGALLGASTGMRAVPPEWLQGLTAHGELQDEIQQLLRTLSGKGTSSNCSL